MKKLVLVLVALLLALCCAVSLAETVSAPASGATFTEGKGVSPENKKKATEYSEADGLIVNIWDGCEITYTVPEGVEGTQDIYLTVAKVMAQFTSQPYSFRINDGEAFSVEIDCQVSADAAAKYSTDGDDYNTGSLYDTGLFLVKSGVELKAGDTVTVIASFGAKAASLKGATYPALGEMVFAPAGTEMAVGYDAQVPVQEEADPSDPLSGKYIIWVGSSVTYGAYSAGHYSMVDAIEDNHAATVCEKFAISATTLVNDSDSSYVARLKLIPKDRTPDLIVVQLSTNDATTGKPFGEVGESFDMADFDDTTIAGAIETIIAYARDTFNCPVAFYSGTYCEKENYAEMVQLLLQIQEKWGIGVIDMFNNAEMTAVFGTEQYDAWMYDQVHPNRAGYIEWWTPVIEQELAAYLTSLAE